MRSAAGRRSCWRTAPNRLRKIFQKLMNSPFFLVKKRKACFSGTHSLGLCIWSVVWQRRITFWTWQTSPAGLVCSGSPSFLLASGSSGLNNKEEAVFVQVWQHQVTSVWVLEVKSWTPKAEVKLVNNVQGNVRTNRAYLLLRWQCSWPRISASPKRWARPPSRQRKFNLHLLYSQ